MTLDAARVQGASTRPRSAQLHAQIAARTRILRLRALSVVRFACAMPAFAAIQLQAQRPVPSVLRARINRSKANPSAHSVLQEGIRLALPRPPSPPAWPAPKIHGLQPWAHHPAPPAYRALQVRRQVLAVMRSPTARMIVPPAPRERRANAHCVPRTRSKLPMATSLAQIALATRRVRREAVSVCVTRATEGLAIAVIHALLAPTSSRRAMTTASLAA
jgi:hypothetical protein